MESKVIVVILTDGEENASQELDLRTVKRIITRCREELAWDFVFLGANSEAFATGRQMGVNHSVAFAATGDGVRSTFNDISEVVSDWRKTGKLGRDVSGKGGR